MAVLSAAALYLPVSMPCDGLQRRRLVHKQAFHPKKTNVSSTIFFLLFYFIIYFFPFSVNFLFQIPFMSYFVHAVGWLLLSFTVQL